MSILTQQLSNLAVTRGFIREVINEGRTAQTARYLAASAVQHSLAADGADLACGPGGVGEFVEVYRRAFPDLRFVVEDEVAENDRVSTRFRMEGTHRESLLGIEPTGRRISVPGIRIDRIHEGRIAESWVSWDRLGLLRQIGALPAFLGRPVAMAEEAMVAGGGLPSRGEAFSRLAYSSPFS